MKLIPHKVAPLNTEPFFHKRGPVGCLLIHGFTGSPPELQFIGEYLAERNITVSGIQLAGHGALPDDMAKTGWRDWVKSAEDGLADLRGKCEEVFVGGLSMGGALTLYLAARNELPAAFTLAGAASIIKDWKFSLIPFVRHFTRFFPKPDGVDLADESALQYLKCYEYIPLDCVLSLLDLTKVVQEGLPKVNCPLLVMQGLKDQLVAPATAQYIYDTVSSADKELVWFENSGHCIPVDVQKELSFKATYAWIFKHSNLRNTLPAE
jgi:carboxylesterase